MRTTKLLLAAALLSAAGLAPARAAIILSLTSVNANINSTGNAFELTLTNSGPSAVSIGGFNFGVSVSNTHLTLQDAKVTTAAAPYIFLGGDSFVIDFLLSDSVMQSTTGQSIFGNDFRLTPFAGTSVGSGATVGLARILFDVDGTALAGPVNATISLLAAETSLADENGANIAINAYNNSIITLQDSGQVIPEPSAYLTLGAGLLTLLWARRRSNL
jgi:hypothetical protein